MLVVIGQIQIGMLVHIAVLVLIKDVTAVLVSPVVDG